MSLSAAQKRRFLEDGYIVIPQAVPGVMIDAARRLINHNLGMKGMNEVDLPSLRSLSYCPDIQKNAIITDLFNRTPVYSIMESLLGHGNVESTGAGQIALRFPSEPGQDPKEPVGHLDGLGSGLNGQERGQYNRGFTALATVYLADVLKPNSGNFTVWPGSHATIEDHLKDQGVDVLGDGQPKLDWPHPPVQITGRAGDAVISHHQIYHTAAPNTSSDVRYAAIFRARHVGCSAVGNAAYTDIWREWEGLADLIPVASGR